MHPPLLSALRPKSLTLLLSLVLLPLVVAGGAILYHRSNRVVEIPGAKFRCTSVHNVSWTAENRQLTVTGEDPFIWIELPSGLPAPIEMIEADFSGTPAGNDGWFEVFYAPALGQPLGQTVAEVVQLPDGGFRVAAKVPPSTVLRLDFPDQLATPLELRRLTLTQSDARLSQQLIAYLVLALFTTAGLLLWWVGRGRKRGTWPVATLLVGIKLWLASDLHLTVFGFARHDDALFVRLARALMDGHWLGQYNDITLAKGPIYPMFLAAVGWSGAPLHLAQAAFHALACLVFVRALRPLVKSSGWRLVLLAMLVFDPRTTAPEAVERVLRVGIQPALVLFALGTAIGLALRLGQPLRLILRWSIGAGCAWSAFWFCREQGIWLVPSAGLVLGTSAVLLWRQHPPALAWRLVFCLIPVASIIGTNGLIRLLNWHYYGAPVAVDFVSGNFPAAYGAITRITPAEFDPRVQTPREARLRAYAVSPSLAELQPELEGEYGQGWAHSGWEGTGVPTEKQDIRPAGFWWALREAAARVGYYTDAKTSEAYWGQVAKELNTACDEGRVAAGPKRDGMAPRWNTAFTDPLLHAIGDAADFVVRFADFRVSSAPSGGTEMFALFQSVTHEAPATGNEPPTMRTDVRCAIARGYQSFPWPLTVLSLAATLWTCFRAAWTRTRWLEPAILIAYTGGATALVLGISLIHVTSFYAISSIYLAPAAPLLIALWICSACWALPAKEKPAANP